MIMRRLKAWPVLAFLAFVPAAVSSQTVEPGGVSATAAGTRLLLRETAYRLVRQDTIEAVLTVRVEASAAGKSQAAVNRLMEGLLAKAKAAPAVTVSTGGYYVSQDFTTEGRPRAWVAQQELNLSSGDSEAVLTLIGDLQGDGVTLGRLEYVLSEPAKRALTDDLAAEAITTLRSRAARIAQSLDQQVVRIETLSVSDTDGSSPPMPLRMAKEASVARATPVAEPGLETVQVSVNATVMLSEK